MSGCGLFCGLVKPKDKRRAPPDKAADSDVPLRAESKGTSPRPSQASPVATQGKSSGVGSLLGLKAAPDIDCLPSIDPSKRPGNSTSPVASVRNDTPSQSEDALYSADLTSGPNRSTVEKTSWRAQCKQALKLSKPILDAIPIFGTIGGSIIDVCLEIVDIAETIESNKEGVLDVSDRLTFLTSQVAVQMKHAKTSDAPNMARLGSELTKKFNEVKMSLKDYANFSLVQKGINKDDISGNIAKMNQQVDDAWKLFGIQETVRYGNALSELEQLIKDIRLIDMAKDLKSMLCPVDSARYDAHNSASGCLHGTRTDLLADILSWASAPGGCIAFWLTGFAGMGKTAISRSLCDALEERSQLGSSFFFSRTGEIDRRRTVAVIPTISFQLGCFHPLFGRAILDVLRATPDAGSREMSAQMHHLIKKPLGTLDAMSRPPVIIVLDGLDECDEMGADLIPLLVEVIARLPFPMKLFVTSRRDEAIERLFTQSQQQSEILHRDLEEVERTVVQADVELYLHHSLRRLATSRRIDPHSWPSGDDVLKLVARAGDFFQYATTVIRYLSQDDDPPRQLLQRLLENDEVDPKSTYEPLDKLYLQIVAASIGTGSRRYIERFRVVVGAVIFTQQPLSRHSLALLLEVDEDYVLYALRKLQSVLAVPDDRDGPIRVHHPSFSDFLSDPGRCDPPFFLRAEEVHSTLACQCFLQLVRRLGQTVAEYRLLCNLTPDGAETLDEGLTGKIAPQEVVYAAVHWATHLDGSRDSQVTVKPDLLRLFQDFCDKSLLVWTDLLQLLGQSYPVGEHGLAVVQRWAENFDMPKHISERIRQVARTSMAPFLFSSSLSDARRGIALWYTTGPSSSEPIELADVGYIRDGTFYKLFNARRAAASDPSHARLGVPEGYEPVVFSDEPFNCTVRTFGRGVLRSTDSIAISDSQESGQTSFKFDGNISAAILVLNEQSTAVTYTRLSLIMLLIDYSTRHRQSWVNFANLLGRSVDKNEIFLVTGTENAVDAARASCLVDGDHPSRSRTCAVVGSQATDISPGLITCAGVDVRASENIVFSGAWQKVDYSHIGYSERKHQVKFSVQNGPDSSSTIPQPGQCIFVQGIGYYKSLEDCIAPSLEILREGFVATSRFEQPGKLMIGWMLNVLKSFELTAPPFRERRKLILTQMGYIVAEILDRMQTPARHAFLNTTLLLWVASAMRKAMVTARDVSVWASFGSLEHGDSVHKHSQLDELVCDLEKLSIAVEETEADTHAAPWDARRDIPLNLLPLLQSYSPHSWEYEPLFDSSASAESFSSFLEDLNGSEE